MSRIASMQCPKRLGFAGPCRARLRELPSLDQQYVNWTCPFAVVVVQRVPGPFRGRRFGPSLENRWSPSLCLECPDEAASRRYEVEVSFWTIQVACIAAQPSRSVTRA